MLGVRRLSLIGLSLLLGISISSLFFILTPERSYSESISLISMDFQNANLNDVLKVFSQQSGLNFIASEDVKDRKLTIYFEKVPVQDALNTIITANNLAYTQVEGTNIFIVKESEKAEVETITQVFPLKYARVSKFGTEGEAKGETVGIKLTVEKLLSEKGRLADDLRTNSLIVIDIPSRLKVIEEAIAKLDILTPQVMIEVEIVDATKKAIDSLGVEWSGAFGTYTGPIRETLYPFSQIFPPGPHGWDKTTATTVGKLDMSGLTAVLKALRTDTNTKYLARPRILTLSNEPAEIKITTDEAIGLATSTTTTGQVGTVTKEAERTETGVSLKVTPQVSAEEGVITMVIEPSVSDAVTGGTFDGTTFKDPETRSAKTTVRLKDGETIVIGGLIRNRSSEIIKKIPLLGDIPGLGLLFRHRERTEPNDRELVVFITPHIIKETEATLAELPEEVTLKEAERREFWSREDEIIEEMEAQLAELPEEVTLEEAEQEKKETLMRIAEEKAKREERERLREEELRLKLEEVRLREERLNQEAEEKARLEEERRLRIEEEARKREEKKLAKLREKEERLEREAELKARHEEEIAKLRVQREDWERRRRETEARRRLEARFKAEMEKEERLKRIAEERAKREEEKKIREEKLAKLKAQRQEELRLKREEEARLKAEKEKEEEVKRTKKTEAQLAKLPLSGEVAPEEAEQKEFWSRQDEIEAMLESAKSPEKAMPKELEEKELWLRQDEIGAMLNRLEER